jgi:predicted kinase
MARQLCCPVNMLMEAVWDIVKNSTTGMLNEHDVVIFDAVIVRRDYLRAYFAFNLM